MSEKIITLNSWQEIIVDFLNKKREIEEEKYLKEQIKKAGEAFKRQNYFNDDNIQNFFDAKKNKKEKGESALNFQRRKAIQIFTFDCIPDEINRYKEKKNYLRKNTAICKKYMPRTWLTINSKNAASVSFATHVIKLTHSKIDSPSLFDCIDEKDNRYMTTSALQAKIIDGAVAGNQFAPIFQFLELELRGEKLASKFSSENEILRPFTDSDEEILEWNNHFKKALSNEKISTHTLAKQFYFPIDGHITKEKYHLLCNVISSSLAHTMYLNIFPEEQKKIKKSREKGEFSSTPSINFIQTAHLCVTASNHSNASQLNGKRGGRLYLFSTQPPIWQSQLKPPIDKKSCFDNFYNTSIKTELNYLRDFLLRFKHLDLSIKDPKRKQWLEKWVNNIIDELLFYAASIQNLPSGWSKNKKIKLKIEHQYFLDPYREETEFQSTRKISDWQSVICNDFAFWLNRQLIGQDKQFTPKKEHHLMWIKLLEKPLREFMESIEQDIKQVSKEAV
ncbi:MAG: type I-F CRISPR-associated protein Csy1 [Pseudomonadota bacterium]